MPRAGLTGEPVVFGVCWMRGSLWGYLFILYRVFKQILGVVPWFCRVFLDFSRVFLGLLLVLFEVFALVFWCLNPLACPR